MAVPLVSAMSKLPPGPIRIVTAAYPPFVNDCGIYTLDRTDECPLPGVDHEILGQLFSYAKIPYELYPQPGDVQWGELKADGSYDGLLGDVINGKYDTVGAQYAITQVRTTKVEFSYNIHHLTATYMVSNAVDPNKEWITSATLIYRVFDWYSMVGLLSVVLLLTAMLIAYSLIIDAGRKGKSFDKTILKDTITSYQDKLVLLLEGKQKYPSFSTGFVFIILAFTVLLMGNLYQGGLFTIMVSPQTSNTQMTEAKVIDKLESKEFRLIASEYSYEMDYFFDNIRYRQEDYYVRFRKILEENPVIIENDENILRERLVNEYGIVHFSPSDLEAYELVYNKCDVTWVPADYDSISWMGFVFRNGSPWLPIISRNTIMISDFVAAAYDRYENGSSLCADNGQQPATPLPLMSLLSVFLLPVLGSLFGIGLCCYEMAKYRQTKRNVKYVLPLVAGEYDIMMFPS